MELAMKLEDKRQEGLAEGRSEGIQETITNLIKAFKQSGSDDHTAFEFAKKSANQQLSDEKIWGIIKQYY